MDKSVEIHDGIVDAVNFSDGKHLIFKLSNRDYGIPIRFINEIIGLMDITPVPETPFFLKGVINLRGKIIPVVDLRLKFKMPEKDYDEKTCIIIVNLISDNKKNEFIGLVVDMVSEVYNIPSSEIETSLQYGLDSEGKYLTGIGKIKEKVVMLLNIESIINIETINGILNQNKN